MASLTCEAASNLIARVADAEIDAYDHASLQAHVARCPACRAELESQRAVRAVLQSRPEASVPPQFHSRLEARLAPSASRWEDWAGWRTWSLGLAPLAGVLMLAAALTVSRSQPEISAEWTQMAELWIAGSQHTDQTPVPQIFWQGEDEALVDVVLGAEPDDTLEEYLQEHAR